MKKLVTAIALLLIAVGFIYPSFNNEVNNNNHNTDLIDDLGIESSLSLNERSKAVVKLTHRLRLDNTYITKSGSAIIIDEDDTYYYAVTNYHIYFKEDYISESLTVTDYYNNDFLASFNTLSQALEIVSLSYDLMVLGFEKPSYDLPVLDLNNNLNLTPSNLLFAVGYPNQIRTVTTGYFRGLTEIETLPYEVIEHDAVINHGNSGGGLFTESGKLVGLNVAGVFDSNNNFITGYAIPNYKILEYLSLFN